jgi:hypothetical protein
MPDEGRRMASVERYLWESLKAVEPSKTRKEGAQRSHAFLRDVLCTGNFEARILEDYLSGSYARDTAIDPLEDVDVIFVIDPNHWQSGLATFIGFKPNPTIVLTSFQRAIKSRYPDSSVAMQRRSVGLRMNHLHIDVVPAIAHESKPDQIWITDRREETWIVSGPRVHAKRATAVNESNGGRFKPLVKLLKFWNRNLPSTAVLRSFTIETMATRIFSSNRFDSLEDGLLKFFDFVGLGERRTALPSMVGAVRYFFLLGTDEGPRRRRNGCECCCRSRLDSAQAICREGADQSRSSARCL